MATHFEQTQSGTTANFVYAGFWARFAAFFVDWAIMFTIAVAIAIVSALAGGVAAVVGQVITFLFYLLYFPYMESSSRQATFGKMLLGIQVTDLDGARVSFVRALLRNIAKIVSALLLYIGFVMAAFTRRKQALHDIMTKCLVVRVGPSHFLRALAAGVGGLIIIVGGGVAYFKYVYLPQTREQAAVAMKGAPAVKPKSASPSVAKAKPPTSAASPAPRPQAAEAVSSTVAGPALTGLEKPGTTWAGPAIIALENVFPDSVWVRVHLPLTKDLEVAPAPEITVTGVLDKSGRNYYDAASPFESGMFLRTGLSRVPTPMLHLVGQRDVHFKGGLTKQTLQKIEGQLRLSVLVDAKSVMLEASDIGKEKPVHGAAVTLKSLAGADAVLHYRGESANALGVRGYGGDGALVAIKSRQFPPRNKPVDMDLPISFSAPVSKVEAIVAASVTEKQYPFSLERGAVAGAPPSATTAMVAPPPPSPVAPSAASAGPRPASAAAAAAAATPPKQASPAPRAQTPAPAKPMVATAAPERAAKVGGEPTARAPRRRPAPAAARSAPSPAEAAAPAAQVKVITPKFNDVMTAVIYDDADAVKQLLDLGWWVDKPSSIGYTPLMAAAMRGEARIAQLLLDYGANPNAAGPAGVTPLALARERKDSGMAALLQARGAR